MIGNRLKSPGAFEDKEVALWYERLNNGIKRRNQEKPRWEENEKFENLEQWGGEFGVSGNDDVTINKVGSFIRSRMASVAYRNPSYVLKPVSPDNWQHVAVPIIDPERGPKVDESGQPIMRPVWRHKVAESLLNFIISRPNFGFNQTIRRLLKAAYLAYGVVKVGYRADFEDVPVDPKNEQMIPLSEDGTPDFSGFLTDEAGNLIEDEDGRWIKRGEPTSEEWFVDWVPYKQMIIDPDGGNDSRQHTWVAFEYLRPLREVKKDRRLKNTKDLVSSGELTYDEGKPQKEKATTENLDPYVKEYSETVRLFECYDFEKNRLVVLADNHAKKLRDDPIPLGIDQDPYVYLRFQEILGEFYPRPVISDLTPINDEYNKYRKQQLIHMRKSSVKILARKSALDDGAYEQLTSPENMAIVQLDLPDGVPLESTIAPFVPPNLSADVYAYGQLIAKDFDEVSGSPGEQRGYAASKTATQAEIMAHGENVREDDDRNQLADALKMVGKKLLDSIQANMTQQTAVMITGSDGQVFQTYVDHNMIVGDFDVDIDITEMMPRRPEVMQARFVQVLQVAGQAPWLFMDEATAAPIFEAFQITDRRFIDGITKGARLQMMMLMAPKQPQKPEAGPPKNTAENRAQEGGGR